MKSFFSLIFFLFFSLPAFSKIYVNIGAPEKIKRSLIALSPFLLKDINPNQDKTSVGEEMEKRLKKNLQFSSYFHILSPKAFIEDPSKKSSYPYPKDPKGFRWRNWKLTGTDFLLFADYSITKNILKVNISLHNIHLQKSLLRKQYKGTADQADQIVDKLTNDIVFSLTKKKGIFETKIISVRSTGGTKKELFIMDWNGENKKRLTYHRSIVLSPVWSQDGNQLVYSAFVYSKKLKKRVAALFAYHLQTNKIKILSFRNGANLGSSFFPNGKSILITLGSGRGLTDIFKLNLKSKLLTPLTKGPFGVINVEPNIHPRTKKVAFSSDRTGKTMIYTMDSNGKNTKQLTFAGHHNSTPVWHPEKKKLVFSGLSGGRMDLFLISAEGTGLKRLTSLRKKNGRWANSESPSFSPDGRFLVFSSNVSGVYQLYVMSLDTLAIQRITFDSYNYKSPKWSPYL